MIISVMGYFLLRPYIVHDADFHFVEAIYAPNRNKAFLFECLCIVADENGNILVNTIDSHYVHCHNCSNTCHNYYDKNFYNQCEFFVSDRKVKSLWFTDKLIEVCNPPDYFTNIERNYKSPNDSIYIRN